MTQATMQHKASPTAPPGAERFLNVFTVQFLHAYYNADDDRCQDFRVVPTPACAAWMKQQGLMFRDRGNGFSVDIPSPRLPGLIRTVGNRSNSGNSEPTPLDFILLLRNPDFIGITAVPITTLPTRQNFCVSNLSTSASKTGLSLGGDADGVTTEDWYPLTGSTLSVIGRRKGTLTVTNMAGAPISPNATVELQAGQPATVDLSASPYGLYAIKATPKTAYAGPPFVLFMPSKPMTCGLISLFLGQPAGQGDARAFPLQEQGLKGVNLQLKFAARQTCWHYYVVSQSGKSAFMDDLNITGTGVKFTRSPARLPSGEHAALFTADTSVPMRQRSPHRFSLSGHRLGVDGGRGSVSVNPLPTACASPVWPSADGDVMSGTSEIYVYV